ncbi:MAG: M67 family metallopeptidase [Ktedonobacterales bacterium]|nr:M67 family metallopeptidase [Ktedonobacterales bacterium]
MVSIPRAIYAAMLAHLRAAYPNEGCGVLAGDGTTPLATRHFPARNAATDAETFSIIAPDELIQIWNAIDGADEDVLAYYHSHPQTQAYPSSRDIRYAQGWPGAYSIITSFAEVDHPVMRAYLIHGDSVTETALNIIDEEVSTDGASAV